jgi:predicted TIM-barrel fold metal-dependent hydrolase
MTDLGRRHFVGLLTTGLAAGTGVVRLTARTQSVSAAKPHRIDIHHHFAPPAWVTAVKGRPLLQPANTTWTPAKSIEDMDRGGVAASIVSITNPGLWFGDAPMTKQLARACNEYGAKLVQDHPARFGLFAAMPLPDVDATLAEIAYAYDTLKAVVHVHPTAANCCRNLDYAPGVAPGSIEYGTDTTRAIMGIAFSGDAVRFPAIRFIWSHAGGSVPFLAGRIEGASGNAKDHLPDGFIAELRKFYYDLAGASNRGAVASLLELVKPSQVLFGTDFPPGGTSAEYVRALAEMKMFSAQDLRAIDRDNALRLLPRLKG